MLVFGLTFKRALNDEMDVVNFFTDDDGIVGIFPRGLQWNVGIVHLAQEFRDVETYVVVDAVERERTCLGELVAVQLHFFTVKDDFLVVAAHHVEELGALPCLEHFFRDFVVFYEIEAVLAPTDFLPIDAENGFCVVNLRTETLGENHS